MINFPKINKIALFSDIHFGKTRDSQLKLKFAENYVDWFLDRCDELGIEMVLFAGDWFNNRNSISVITMNVAYGCLKKISAKFPVVMVLGNHDTAFKTSVETNSIKMYSEMDNVTVVENFEEMLVGERRFALCPWNTDITDKRGYDFGICHLEFAGALKHEGCAEEENSKTYSMKDMFDIAPLLFVGHYHIRKDYVGSDSRIISIGSATELDWGDCDNEKGFYVLDARSRSYDFVRNNVTPIHFKYYWSKLKSKEQAVSEDKIMGNFVKLVVDEKYDFNDVMQVIMEINSKNPLRPCEPDYIFNANIDLMQRGHTFESSGGIKMTKLQYMNKFVDKMSDEAMNGLDRGDLKRLVETYYVKAEES